VSNKNITEGFPAFQDELRPYRRFYACPYYVKDLRNHVYCLKYDLSEIRDVIEHLWWKHTRPLNCPTCGTTFTSTKRWNEHVVSRVCHYQSHAIPEGISSEKQAEIRAVGERGTSKVDQWFQIWSIIFDNSPPPKSPYVAEKKALAVTRLRKFWSAHGREIVGTFFNSHGMFDWRVPNEERKLEAVKLAVFIDLLCHQVGHLSMIT
jgi:hypothetical protein